MSHFKILRMYMKWHHKLRIQIIPRQTRKDENQTDVVKSS